MNIHLYTAFGHLDYRRAEHVANHNSRRCDNLFLGIFTTEAEALGAVGRDIINAGGVLVEEDYDPDKESIFLLGFPMKQAGKTERSFRVSPPAFAAKSDFTLFVTIRRTPIGGSPLQLLAALG